MAEVTIQEEDKEWLAAVGQMAVYWADLEIHMDAYLAVMLAHPSSTAVVSQSLPMQEVLGDTFNKRIRLWKELVAVLPINEELKQQNLDSAQRIRDARNHRDLLLHGETRRHPDGVMKAHHLPKKAGHKIQHIPYPPEKVLKIAGDILELNANVIYLMVQTMDQLVGEPDKRSEA